MIRLLSVITLLFFAGVVESKVYNRDDFSSQVQYQRYHGLIDELRCLVCQNQNLASSDAELASNLRDIVVEQLQAGRTDNEIRDFMVERYGNFVLYDPPFILTTVLLWAGPLLLLLLGLAGVVVFIRKQTQLVQEDESYDG